MGILLKILRQITLSGQLSFRLIEDTDERGPDVAIHEERKRPGVRRAGGVFGDHAHAGGVGQLVRRAHKTGRNIYKVGDEIRCFWNLQEDERKR